MGIVDSRNMIMIALLTDDNDDDCLICWWWLGWGLDSSNHLNMIGILWTSLIKPWFLNERYEIRLLPPHTPFVKLFHKIHVLFKWWLPLYHPPTLRQNWSVHFQLCLRLSIQTCLHQVFHNQNNDYNPLGVLLGMFLHLEIMGKWKLVFICAVRCS